MEEKITKEKEKRKKRKERWKRSLGTIIQSG